MKAWLERRVPELVAAFYRFPLAIVFAAGAVAALLCTLNELEWFRSEGGARLFFGSTAGAAFAVGGVLFRESRPDKRWSGIVVAYALPLLVFGISQVSDTAIIFPFFLPVVGALWTSIAAFTTPGRGADRSLIQDRFWWLNQRALITAAVVGAGFLLIVVGIASIERAVSILFRLDISRLAYKWVMPILGGVVAPTVWLSTIPKLSDFDPKRLESPDFLSRAIAFLGQYIAAPLLLIYALILIVYAFQIVITQTLPEGLIGWMVLYFAVSGVGTWLVLHPPYARTGPVASFYRGAWWWLTIVPLLMFGIAVMVRVDAYGLTTERVLVIAGGLWAALLTVVFLTRFADIRLIPGIAAAILLILSIGPWNVIQWPVRDQAARLDFALERASPKLAWTDETTAMAFDATLYLYNNQGKAALAEVARKHGFELTPGDYAPDTIYRYFKIGDPRAGYEFDTFTVQRGGQDNPIDVSATPFLIGGPLYIYETASSYDQYGVRPRIEANAVVIGQGEIEKLRINLTAWVKRQQANEPIVTPWIDYVLDGRSYRLTIDSATISIDRRATTDERTLSSLYGMLFAGLEPVTPPTRIDDSEVSEHPAMLPLPDAPTTTPTPAPAVPSP